MLATLVALALCQVEPMGFTTRPEDTGYTETSSYDDVIRLLARLETRGSMRVEFIGESTEGHRIPLVVVADSPAITPEEARAAGKVVVYVQANIHGGEVEGKEAVQRLLIDVDPADPMWKRLVLLVTPVYNIDGNEALGDGVENRPSQNGPARVGQRANGQGLDLNRDCIKAESPEMQAVLRHVYVPWDPEVVLDLHTTNGTRHGFALTYAPPLNPNTEPGLLAYARDVLLPEVRRRVRERSGLEIFDYGNVWGSRDSWTTFGHEGRYVTNYVGLRNRIGLLSEAVSYAAFEDRVTATRAFVDQVLGFVVEHADQVREVTAAADLAVAEAGGSGSEHELAVAFDSASRGEEAVPLEDPEAATGRRQPVTHTVPRRLQIVDRFTGTRTAPVPDAYAFQEESVARLLTRHGVTVERLSADWKGAVTRFVVSADRVGRRPYQGHQLHRLEGASEERTEVLPTGTFLVRLSQPLGVLVFHILEPESSDGAVTWGFFGDAFETGRVAPIAKLFNPGEVAAEEWR